jgi:hypothetical protein
MTTILPAETSPWQVIDKAIGNQISQNLPGAVEKGYERAQIQQGLGQLSQTNPELKPILDLMSSVAGTRQGAQYAEALMPEITKIMQTKQQAAPQTGRAVQDIQNMLDTRQQPIQLPSFGEKPQEPTFQQPTKQGQLPQPSFDDVSNGIQERFGEQYFPFAKKAEDVAPGETRRPQKPPKPPKPIGPSEEHKIRSMLAKEGVTRKDVQDDYINRFKQNQADEYKAAQEGYKSLATYQAERAREDDRFFQSVLPSVRGQFPGMGPEEENIWKGIARTNEDVGSDEARLRDANQRYNQLVEQPLAAFSETGPALPYFSSLKPEAVADAIEDSRSMIQGHLNTINEMPTSDQFPRELKGEITNFLRKKYRTEMTAKDFGVAQSAYAVSNLGDRAKSALDSIPKYPTPKTHPEEPLVVQPEKRDLLTNELSKALMKLGPEDSIILARDYAIKNHYPDEVYNRALNIALKNGLQLSPFQMQERPELSIPQRMDLNSILRGKRSTYDLFKGKK